jgi:hypothetical protein
MTRNKFNQWNEITLQKSANHWRNWGRYEKIEISVMLMDWQK